MLTSSRDGFRLWKFEPPKQEYLTKLSSATNSEWTAYWTYRSFHLGDKTYQCENQNDIFGYKPSGAGQYDPPLPLEIKIAVRMWYKSTFVDSMPVYQFLQQVLGDNE